jgi:hypothetical protein
VAQIPSGDGSDAYPTEVLTVADLLSRNAPVPVKPEPDTGGISVGALLRREGRAPHAADRPLQPRPHQQAADEEGGTGRRTLVRRGAIAAGTLVAAGSMFGAAVLTDITPTGNQDDRSGGAEEDGPYPGQGLLDQEDPVITPADSVVVDQAAAANQLDAGSPAPSDWIPVAFPGALAGDDAGATDGGGPGNGGSNSNSGGDDSPSGAAAGDDQNDDASSSNDSESTSSTDGSRDGSDDGDDSEESSDRDRDPSLLDGVTDTVDNVVDGVSGALGLSSNDDGDDSSDESGEESSDGDSPSFSLFSAGDEDSSAPQDEDDSESRSDDDSDDGESGDDEGDSDSGDDGDSGGDDGDDGGLVSGLLGTVGGILG